MSKSPFNSIWDKYGAEISIAGLLLLVWKFWGLFRGVGNGLNSVGDTVASAVAGATATVHENGKRAQQKAAIKVIFPGATDADVVKFESDAKTIAQACAANSALWANSMNTNWQAAYAVAKRYSRKMYRVEGGKLVVLGDRALKFRLPVLFSFYEAATNGRSLMADLDNVMLFATKDAQQFYLKYVK